MRSVLIIYVTRHLDGAAPQGQSAEEEARAMLRRSTFEVHTTESHIFVLPEPPKRESERMAGEAVSRHAPKP